MAEREVKVSFDGPAALSTEALVAGIGSSTIDHVDQDATYFDTDSLALTRAGASLRFRSDDGWTVKLPGTRSGGELVRDEQVLAGEEGDPPAAAIDLVRAWSRSARLSAVARVHTRRERAVVDDATGAIIEVVIDDVEGRALADGRSIRFLEAEVESKRADVGDAVSTVVDRLVALGGDARTPMPKVARVLGAGATAAADVVEPPKQRQPASIEDVVRDALAKSTRRLLECDAAVQRDTDGEGVHQARTAARRLRSDLRTFRPWLDREWCQGLRAELRWLGSELGRVRDANVMLDGLEAKTGTLPHDERAHADALIERLTNMRRREFEALLDSMRSDRYVVLLDQLVAASHAPRFGERTPADNVLRDAKRVARKRARGMRKEFRGLAASPPAHDLHEIRKHAKQARYAFEAIAPVLGKPASRAADSLKTLQDTLGAHQDAVVAIDWLAAAARDSDSQDLAFVAGRLAVRYEFDMIEARHQWRSDWKRARRDLKRVK